MSSSTGALVPRKRSGTALSRPQTCRPPPPPTLRCNLCTKPLETTCFLCACDCIFCEECTYSHFEQSSRCPICTKTLNENDFTELVVADATSATTDIAKTSLQALFSKQSKSAHGNSKALPLSDLCFSLVRQIDVVKQSTKFLLKQLLMDSNGQGRKVQSVMRSNEYLKQEITNLKQGQSSQRLQFEQVSNDLKNRLNARERTIQDLQKKISEKDRMIEQFRRLHSGSNASIDGSRNGQTVGGMLETSPVQRGALHQMQHNSFQSCVDSRYEAGGKMSSSNEPPLRGIIQRQAQQAAQQQAFLSRSQPVIKRSRSSMSSHGRGAQMIDRRPFTSTSVGSNSLSSTPRVRDLSHSSGFSFSSNESRLNKRRRGGEPSSASRIMSPSTAFTLNQGVHSIGRGGQTWSTGGYPGR